MARIKIVDLPKDQKITKEEMKRVKGGVLLSTSTSLSLNALKIDGTTNLLKETSDTLLKMDVNTFEGCPR
jgi:hypothetical protein